MQSENHGMQRVRRQGKEGIGESSSGESEGMTKSSLRDELG